MTVYDTEMGTWVNGAVVPLPSGSDGDQLVLIAFVGSNPGFLSGWTLRFSDTAGAGPRRIYTKTRSGGETTVTLPVVPGVSDLSVYALLDVEAGVLYNDADFKAFTTSTWSFTEAYNREDPRFAFAVLDTRTSPLTVTGDFVEKHSITRASDSNNTARTYVADELSGTIDIDASGEWPSFGVTSWLVAFFSPEIVVATSRWGVGKARMGGGAWS